MCMTATFISWTHATNTSNYHDRPQCSAILSPSLSTLSAFVHFPSRQRLGDEISRRKFSVLAVVTPTTHVVCRLRASINGSFVSIRQRQQVRYFLSLLITNADQRPAIYHSFPQVLARVLFSPPIFGIFVRSF